MDCVIWIPDENNFYKAGTLAVFILGAVILLLVHYLCPIDFRAKRLSRYHRNRNAILLKKMNHCHRYAHGVLSPQNSNARTALSHDRLFDNKLTINSMLGKDHKVSSYLEGTKQLGFPKVHFSFGEDKSNQSISGNKRNFEKTSLTALTPRGHQASINSPSKRVKQLPRCISAQDIATQKQNNLTSYNSMPSVHRPPSEQYMTSNPGQGTTKAQSVPSLQVNGRPYYHRRELGEDVDEGQMQCILQYDKHRSRILLKSLAIQTVLPLYTPGFVVEVATIPSNNRVLHSKVYETVNGMVDVTLDETFEIEANDYDVKNRSLLISVKSVLENFKLYAETELTYLNLVANGEVYLGGFLKGVYVNSNQ